MGLGCFEGSIKKCGVRNSLLVAPMPTASTSLILGNNECFEPYTSNIYNRRVKAGEFTIVNRQLVEDLMELGLWNKDMKNKIVAPNGFFLTSSSSWKDNSFFFFFLIRIVSFCFNSSKSSGNSKDWLKFLWTVV